MRRHKSDARKPYYVYADTEGEFIFQMKFTDEFTAQQLHQEREHVEDDPFARMTGHVAR